MMIGMASARRTIADLADRVARVCACAQDPLELLERVAALVRAVVPYDAAGWLLVDPDTLLLNGVYAEDVPRGEHLSLIECELTQDDVTKFFELARADVPAASMSAATGGALHRSFRWRAIYEPAGFGDELRAVFRSGSAVWGHACLTRRAEEPWFSRTEVDLVARVCPHIGHGIRASLLLRGLAAPELDAGPAAEAPALVVLADDGTVESATPQAETWFGDLEDERLDTTIVLHEVAHQARALAVGGASGPPARAWACTLTGETVIVRGARLRAAPGRGGRTALVMEPARRTDIAPLLLELHQLTEREREVTRLLLVGMSTRDIARELWITQETLRGHVKSVFAKVGVRSRPELAALLSQPPRSREPSVEPAVRQPR